MMMYGETFYIHHMAQHQLKAYSSYIPGAIDLKNW